MPYSLITFRLLSGIAFSILFTFLVALPSGASAGVQRMVFVPQTLHIPAGEATAAKAFCLDFHADTPTLGQAFGFAPGSLGQIGVTIGNKHCTIQQAIDEKKLAIVGTGDFQSLQIKNLGTEEARVDVNQPSVAAVDQTYSTADISPVLDKLDKVQSAGATQQLVWNLRDADIAKNLFDPDHVGTYDNGRPYLKVGRSRYDADFGLVQENQRKVDSTNGSGPAQSLIVQRLEAAESSETRAPLYLLYTPGSKPGMFTGNRELGELTEAAKAAWTGSGRKERPVITMLGDGEQQDFDAAMLTMTVKSSGGLDGKRPDSFPLSFDSPEEFRDLPESFSADVADPPDWQHLTITKRGGSWIGVRKVGSTVVTVVAKTAELVAEIMARVGDVLAEFAMLLTEERMMSRLSAAEQKQIAERIRVEIEDAVHTAYDNDPELRDAQNGDGVKVDIRVGRQTISAVIAHTAPPVHNGNSRLAIAGVSER